MDTKELIEIVEKTISKATKNFQETNNEQYAQKWDYIIRCNIELLQKLQKVQETPINQLIDQLIKETKTITMFDLSKQLDEWTKMISDHQVYDSYNLNLANLLLDNFWIVPKAPIFLRAAMEQK